MNSDRLHLFWLPAMLVAFGVYAFVPLHIGKLWFAFPWGLALFSGLMALFALIGTRTSLLEKASDVAWLNKALRWLQPLCALLGALLLALAADLLVNWQRGSSGEWEAVLRRTYCTFSRPKGGFHHRVPQLHGKWCFNTQGKDIAINLPVLGRREGVEMQGVSIPVRQIRRPVPLGETVNARWRSYHSIFGVANAYYQITDIH